MRVYAESGSEEKSFREGDLVDSCYQAGVEEESEKREREETRRVEGQVEFESKIATR